jgi:hypothetical protein
VDHVDQLRQLGRLLRRYYAPELREPLSDDVLTLAASLESRLRGRELSQVEATAAETARRPVKLMLVYSRAESRNEGFANT